ncbi:hypothetical protein HPB51_007816 [Rhipicephalus microplus]|uniref:Uncharacterized protein n=1 Tax=Rhipicephalus microplus TaxID=6941 RepID=A0A9J6F079_RHIMP|nr:hypothetical protein HPB51_007816 [Rhipicephalus microplus]
MLSVPYSDPYANEGLSNTEVPQAYTQLLAFGPKHCIEPGMNRAEKLATTKTVSRQAPDDEKARQQCRAFEALKTRRILPKFRRLDDVPTVASMDVATCEDISFLVRRVVREELVRLEGGDVHHQCSFAACPEPPPYWMRERHAENRPRTETEDFTPRLPFSPTGRGHHRMSSSRRAAADLRSSSTRPLPEDYYASSQNVPAERDPSARTSAAYAAANHHNALLFFPLLTKHLEQCVQHLLPPHFREYAQLLPQPSKVLSSLPLRKKTVVGHAEPVMKQTHLMPKFRLENLADPFDMSPGWLNTSE